jgi:hypothetical protein
VTDWIRRRWRLARLRHRERHLAWLLSIWPDDNAAQVLDYVRYARQQAELGLSYPPTRTRSR